MRVSNAPLHRRTWKAQASLARSRSSHGSGSLPRRSSRSGSMRSRAWPLMPSSRRRHSDRETLEGSPHGTASLFLPELFHASSPDLCHASSPDLIHTRGCCATASAVWASAGIDLSAGAAGAAAPAGCARETCSLPLCPPLPAPRPRIRSTPRLPPPRDSELGGDGTYLSSRSNQASDARD